MQCNVLNPNNITLCLHQPNTHFSFREGAFQTCRIMGPWEHCSHNILLPIRITHILRFDWLLSLFKGMIWKSNVKLVSRNCCKHVLSFFFCHSLPVCTYCKKCRNVNVYNKVRSLLLIHNLNFTTHFITLPFYHFITSASNICTLFIIHWICNLNITQLTVLSILCTWYSF